MDRSPHERWDGGDTYERYMGRWSASVASRFLDWLGLETQLRWLDVGCGTGALTRAMTVATEPAAVVGIDASLSFLQHAKRQLGSASFVVADAGTLPMRDGAYDVVVAGLALNFLPEPARMVFQMRRVVGPAGTVAAYVWDYAEGMEFLRYFWDTAAELDRDARELHEGYRFPICRPDPLRDLWQAAGLSGVQVAPVEIPTVFANFQDYWSIFLTGHFPAPKYVLSLDEPRRNALRDELRRVLRVKDKDAIPLTARAWAVRGTR